MFEKIDGYTGPYRAICGDEQVVKNEPRTIRKHPISLDTQDSVQTRTTEMLAARRHQMSAGRTAPAKAAAKPSTVTLSTAGGVERNVGKRGGGMWAALADSDTETDTEEMVSVPVAKTILPVVEVVKKVVPVPLPSAVEAEAMITAMFADDPFFAAMERGEIKWGDLLSDNHVAIRVTPAPAPAEDDEPLRELWTNPRAPLRAKEAEIWQQPFSANLEEYWPETYDTRAMSDEDYHALMGWLYSKGWYVDHYDREGVRTWQDNAPASRWDAEAMAPEDERRVHWAETRHEEAAEPKKVFHACRGGERAPKPKGGVVIPRFCREGHACSAAGGSCRYVHGDTIPRIKEACTFGEACGASDPTGVKRSQCLRMHPGEVWTPELVIRRI